ncbi:hypothetical protein ACFQ1M_04180 [Sungkyunkwania multivorans]|uniref:Uncharacterized protein n=1 Tax=Sungkyunkwania multivorans TaxID=1173618 RepID=A0ABW3CX08_9FLAO
MNILYPNRGNGNDNSAHGVGASEDRVTNGGYGTGVFHECFTISTVQMYYFYQALQTS